MQNQPSETLLAGEGNFTPFHEDLHLMQIDAVFDGLSVLIETERLKLKRMINGQVVQGKNRRIKTSDA